MTIEEFGQTIKAKYPAYKDMPDAELGQKMLAKYPQYQDLIGNDDARPASSVSSPATAQEESNPIGDFANKAVGVAKQFAETTHDFVVGQAKGALKTAVGIGTIGNDMLLKPAYDATIGRATGTQAPSSKPFRDELKEKKVTAPSNTAQTAGFMSEQIGEYFVPVGAANAAGNAANAAGTALKLPKVAVKVFEIAARIGAQGLEQGARTAAQEGEVLTEDGKLNPQVAMSTAIGAGVESLGLAANFLLRKLGDAFYSMTVPSTITEKGRDLRKGLEIGESLDDTGISLTRKQLLKKIAGKINIFGSKLDDVVDSATKDGLVANFDDFADDVVKKMDDVYFAKDLQATPIELDSAREEVLHTLEQYRKLYGGKPMPAEAIQSLKRKLGDGLVKVFDRSMTTPMKSKAWTENSLYSSFNTFLQDNIPNYGQLNKKLAPLLEAQDRILGKGAYSGLLTDVIAGGMVGSTGGSILTNPKGFFKNAILGVLVKRGMTSTAARTLAGTIAIQMANVVDKPEFWQMIRIAIQKSQEPDEPAQ